MTHPTTSAALRDALRLFDHEKVRQALAALEQPQHASDCAVHNAPALEPGPCDCTPSPGASWTDDELEPAARALFEDVFPEDTWEDCPGLHDDVFSSVRVVIAKLPIATLNATPGAQQSDNQENRS